MNNRIISLDYAKVLVIYLVVLGHFTYSFGITFEDNAVWNIMHAITLFHMPFFFIVSGMLFRQSNIKTIIKKGWTQLMIPYLLIAALSLLCVLAASKGINIKDLVKYVLGIISGYDAPKSLRLPCAAMWFCYALFFIKIIYSVTVRGGVLLDNNINGFSDNVYREQILVQNRFGTRRLLVFLHWK